MKSVLSALYDGELHPAEQYTPQIKEYWEIRQRNRRHYRDFTESLRKLNPPLDKRFIQILDEQIDELPYELSQMFADGFRLGARLMLEALQDNSYTQGTGSTAE